MKRSTLLEIQGVLVTEKRTDLAEALATSMDPVGTKFKEKEQSPARSVKKSSKGDKTGKELAKKQSTSNPNRGVKNSSKGDKTGKEFESKKQTPKTTKS